MKVTIFNDTSHTFVVRDGIFLKPSEEFRHVHHFYSGTTGRICPVNQEGSSYTYEFFEDTVKDWNLFLLEAAAVGSSEVSLIIPAEDNEQASEIRVYKKSSKEIKHWISKPRGSSDELRRPVTPAIKNLVSFEAVKGEVGTRMETVERNRVNLQQVLKQVRICHAQCSHLVQTYSKGIQKMIEMYSLVSKDLSRMWSLYESKKLRLLSSSLDSLLRSLIDCFWINRSDLHFERCISRGSFKKIYRGEWFGQPVAIAKIKGCTRDSVEKEAGFMVNVQHPNIVDFFGYSHVEDRSTEDGNPSLTGFLVMELMQEDLRSLINREAKCHSGAPFSFSVLVEILLQIVEAMMHLHKHHVMYRDLKATNCLVSPRPKSSPQDPDVYTVKLIDFGTSKRLNSENDETATVDVGTRRWMAPEVWATTPSKRVVKSSWEHVRSFGNTYRTATCLCPRFLSREQPIAKEQEGQENSYSRSADVYSFAMTCYEITTGLLPFHDVESSDIPKMIFREERPLFSHPAAITCPPRLQKLMTDCWAQKPSDRPRFEAIRRELWSIKHDIEVQR